MLMALVSLDDPGLTVFATHRLLSGLRPEPAASSSPTGCAQHFEVEEVRRGQLDPAGEPGIGVFGYIDSRLRREPQRLRLQRHGRARPRARRTSPTPTAQLDAAILEELVLKGALGMSEDDIAAKRGLGYVEEHRRGPWRRSSPASADCALPAPPDPGRAGARRRRGRRDDAAEVDLLLPQAADGHRLQPAELSDVGSERDPDLHPQGRRRHDLALVRRAGAEVATPAPRPTARSTRPCSALGVARSLCGDRRRRARRGHPPRPERAASSPAPSWRPRPRPPSGSRTASAGSPTRWSTSSTALIDRYMDRVELPPKFVIPGRHRRSPRSSTSHARSSAAPSAA